MKIEILKQDLKVKVRKDDQLKLQIAETCGVKVSSVDRWLREDNIFLTTTTNLKLIREHFSLDESEEMTEEKETVVAIS